MTGCSIGEEAYSIAILLREHMDNLQVLPKVKIFATDIDEANDINRVRSIRLAPASTMNFVDPTTVQSTTGASSRAVRSGCRVEIEFEAPSA